MDTSHDVLAELEILRAEISRLKPDAVYNDNGPVAVLFRILDDFSRPRQAELESRLNPLPWMIMPLDGELYPALTRIQQKINDLSHAAGHDHLTGLALRGVFEQTLHSEMERTRRSGLSLSLAILDIDDFKKINDICGHVHGDLVLRSVAAILRDNIRQSDLGVRLGGEEFAILMPDTTQTSGALLLARVMDAVRNLRFDCPNPAMKPQVTVSVGLACYKGFKKLQPQELVEMADQALYAAKQSGKNRLVKSPFRDISPELSSHTLVDSDEKNYLFRALSS
ncbi:diguanylate cyclase (GGDEF) domain-containing protein [Desulfonatronum thiosulfatophilum]|uniref:diguanylate cyclase n=1 Tax=Desulfonatronum thiosulfatophilum TaxID=617002 RepID=A0A1G6BQ90_9BACT|nr:GGDEF domain-containing protein [Desulfonatronum thiosulfatophilum]SDB22804.1 diguanylate cyclase (GGDEF) domain-containing protein [Desulfonatronum thiosulfatophilum]